MRAFSFNTTVTTAGRVPLAHCVYFKAPTVPGLQMFSLNQMMSSISQSATLLSFHFSGNLNVSHWGDAGEHQMRHMETLLYLSNAAPFTTAPFAFSLLSLTQNNQTSVRIRPHRQQREGKSDGWEMNTLSKSKVPQVWTPIIYRQSSNPCQRAVSFWTDLSRLSSLPWPGWPAPSTAQCTLSLSSFLTLKLSFSLLSISAGLPTFSSLLLLKQGWSPLTSNLQFQLLSKVFSPSSKIVYLFISFVS